MRTSPSIAPHDGHQDIYIVLDDFGSLGRAWRETDEAGANRAALVRNLLDGQYENPVRIVAFNTTATSRSGRHCYPIWSTSTGKLSALIWPFTSVQKQCT
jgi:hypothetical protein